MTKRKIRKNTIIKNNAIYIILKKTKKSLINEEEKIMAILTVQEVLEEISATRKEDGSFNYNRFNKKNFEKLMKAMLNDPNFKTEVAKVKDNNLEIEEIEVSKEFRKFCKKVIEKAGVDKAESERII